MGGDGSVVTLSEKSYRVVINILTPYQFELTGEVACEWATL